MPEIIEFLKGNSDWLDSFFGMIFSFVATILGVLAYFHARKVLFQPVRSEVIKKQTEILTQMLETLFNPIDLSIGYQDLTKLNMFMILDDYGFVLKNHSRIRYELMGIYSGEMLFGDKEDKLPEHVKVETFNDSNIDEKAANEEFRKQRYEDLKKGIAFIGRIRFTKKYEEFMTTLKKFEESPFLPSQIRTILQQLIADINWNINNPFREVLKSFILQLSGKNTSLETVSVQSDGIYNDFNSKRKPHKPKYDELRDAIRTYLRIDEKW